MHCHIPDHEDQGAMGWMNVTGGTPPPTYPGGDYSTYYSLSSEPPPPPPTDPTSVTIDTVSASTVSAGKGTKRGRVEIMVVDDLGDPVANAQVTGVFKGSFDEPAVSPPTDTSGRTVIASVWIQRKRMPTEFRRVRLSAP